MVILYLIIGFICLIVPLILTLLNIINLFKKKKIKENLIDILIFVLGIPLTIILYSACQFKDYNQSLLLGWFEADMHAPIASWSMPTVMAIFVLGIISYFLIRIRKLKLPPLIIVASMSGILICSIYMIIFIIQLGKNSIQTAIFGYLTIFPINYILCSIRAQIDVMRRYKEKNIKSKKYNNRVLNKCSEMLYDINNWPVIAILLVIPLVFILICILVLFGQRPDEAIKAFKELVKPIRMGIRKGEKIVVNRQLCVANAFEALIQEKTPKFHHFIRHIYDKYGYPLSKHINTALQADMVYILMKPLEWIFILILYLCDEKPENRIAMQYTGNKICQQGPSL